MRKRAEYEAFEFSLADDGVRVRNASHAEPSEHEYRVRVVDGLPTTCTCPADEHHDGACKHRVAVAINYVVLEPALDEAVATDGGTIHEDEVRPKTDTETECDCEGLPRGVPCWPCYREGNANFEPQVDARNIDS